MAHTLRVPKLDLVSILAQQNPQIDLRLDAYESSTRSFLKAVSAYAQNAQAEIMRRKTTHVAEKKRIAEKTQSYENETHACKVRELELIAELEKEREERKDAELAVAAFERQLASIKDQCALLDVEIEQRRAVVNNLRREREREHALLNTHASRTSPELTECEFRLRSVVEGIDKDKILVRFTHIDPADPQREFSVVVDVSEDIYRVPTTSPFLPNLPILLDQLNSSRDVYAFIKSVRQAFEDLVSR
ncbi:Spindle Spc25 domain-containing protein [Phanerochaete sordida]|uniref:Kinetochore protein SPC25 n=1 Tax=Phanerochaete sordida TaxID=48140 RepID=A0A9P3GC53_9APHY|nr:Spindle Spc25 domain-containing protein [Phanerochaete sordida]